MASADAVSPSSARRSLRHLLFSPPSPSSPRPHRAADWNPLIAPPPPQPPPPRKKKGLAAAAFRGLGCASASASQAYAPAAAAAVRASADWQGKRPRRRREKKKAERKNQAIGDVWCAPGMPFAAEASVDCVVAHQPMVARGRPDAAGRIHREVRPCIPRRAGHREEISTFMDSPPVLDTPFFGPDLFPSGHLRHLRGFHRAPGGLEELMMFQTRILLGGGLDVYDRFREWRLDVDNMSYEELLELGDKIGSVSTGLREEEIARSLRKIKHSVFDASARHLATEIERKCSICQEEYEANDETGRLECGHGYHMYCIKQWLLLKNACPVCKAPVPKT
ncbi:zinc finger, C3HC4 type, domain containing protein [Musa troglodytarum]|uniref:RING-type E3 ubiquitin transferase n=1 Tax=Musa troglodytarum TaxID=320322 RepID=A0A9E7EBT7_9LILI|nr:zinc finger, C3HC4 type, domain containing protein [Musa troglodytarum]